MIFSFLEMEEPEHDRIWDNVLTHAQNDHPIEQLDAFPPRAWIRKWARQAGYEEAQFTDGTDGSKHPEFWQSLAILRKPAS